TSRSTPPGNLAEAIACIEDDAAHGRRPAMFAALRELAGLSAADEETPVAPPAIERAPAPAAALKSAEQPCPTCGSFTLHRSKAKNLPERVWRQFSAQRLFRCTTCRWRGWLLPMHINDAGAVEPAAIPDLAAPNIDGTTRALKLALFAVGAAIALQIVPVPNALVRAVSPQTGALVTRLSPAFAAGLQPLHPVSVWPRDTRTALALFAALALLCA